MPDERKDRRENRHAQPSLWAAPLRRLAFAQKIYARNDEGNRARSHENSVGLSCSGGGVPPHLSCPGLIFLLYHAAYFPESGMDEKHIEQLDRLAKRLENSGVAEYVKLQQRTGKILWLNFISGVARGLGFTVGTALVLAVVYKILARLISMNIPYLTETLQRIVEIVQSAGGAK